MRPTTRPQAALDFWYEATQTRGAEPLDPLLGYRVFMANCKLEPARDLARKYPRLFPNVADGLDALIAMHRARTVDERTAPAPSLEAAGMHRRDARRDLIGMSPEAAIPFLHTLESRDVYRANPTSDHYRLFDMQLPEGLKNFELRLSFTMAPTDTRKGGFVKLARLNLGGIRSSADPDRNESSLLGHVELEVPSGFSMKSTEPGDDVYFPDPLISANGKRQNRIWFVRVGGQLELFVNDRRVLYQPVGADVFLYKITFQVVGATLNVSEFGLDELIRRL